MDGWGKVCHTSCLKESVRGRAVTKESAGIVVMMKALCAVRSEDSERRRGDYQGDRNEQVGRLLAFP